MSTLFRKMFELKATGVENESGVYDAIITSDNIDSDREVLLSSGLNPTRFEKTRSILWNHNDNLPIAKNLFLTKDVNQWKMRFKMMERPEDYHGEFFPDLVRGMIDQKIVNGMSVGYLPQARRKPTKKDIEDYGEKINNIITQWELAEVSIVACPSNVNSLINSVKNLIKNKSLTYESGKIFCPELIKEEPIIEIPEIFIYEVKTKKISVEDRVKETIQFELDKQKGKLYY
jgi:hypothetical protein